MKMYGKIIWDTKVLKNAVYENKANEQPFNDRLEDCLINVCKKLDIPVPLWVDKNTKEFARFRKTSFAEDQFFEPVMFDRFEFRVDID